MLDTEHGVFGRILTIGREDVGGNGIGIGRRDEMTSGNGLWVDWVVLAPFQVSPRIGVTFEPAYVVAITIWGRSV